MHREPAVAEWAIIAVKIPLWTTLFFEMEILSEIIFIIKTVI